VGRISQGVPRKVVFNYLYKKLIRPIFLIRSSPHSIALGVALGIFITLTPTVGVQMLLVFVIGTLIKANRIIALILCWLSNPLTVPPLYYGYYYLGAKLLGLDLWTISNFSKKLDVFRVALDELGMAETIELFWDGIIWPMWLGSFVIAAVVSVPCYPLTRYLLRRQREIRSIRWRERRALLEARRRERKNGALQGNPREDARSDRPENARSDRPKNADSLPASSLRDRALPKAILFALFSTILCACSSCGEPDEGTFASNPAHFFGDGFAVVRGELEKDCSFFLEFRGLKDDELNYACLRIYNFSEQPCDAEGLEHALYIFAQGARRPLRPVKDLDRRDLSGVQRLLPLGSPTPEVPPRNWTRILLAYEGRAFSASEGKVLFEMPAGDRDRRPEIGKKVGGGERREVSKDTSPSAADGSSSLELLDVSCSVWDLFVRNPTKKRLAAVVNR
jgi:uncharacterized protein